MIEAVLPLDDPALLDPTVAGGKAAGLVRLRRAGLPVPVGFAVTAGAPTTALHPAAADAIRAAYRELGAGGDVVVAVRSSATFEDTTASSGAGQLHTLLGVSGPDAVVDAVRECRRSAATPAAAHYTRRHGTTSPMVGVVVQPLVRARTAGVAFSMHPVSGDTTRLVIEAAPGLGISVVDGRVVPEHVEVDRTTGAVLQRRRGARLVRVSYDDEKHALVTSTAPGGDVLTEDVLPAVIDLTLAAEQAMRCPVDVEWVVPDERSSDSPVVLVQGRPITLARR